MEKERTIVSFIEAEAKKNCWIHTRVSTEEKQMLQDICNSMGWAESHVMRGGLKKMFEEIKRLKQTFEDENLNLG